MSTHLVPCPRGGACGKGARHDDRRSQIEVCRRAVASSGGGSRAATAPPPPAPAASTSSPPALSPTAIEVHEDSVGNAMIDRNGVLVLGGDGVVRGGPPDEFEEGLADGTSILLTRPREVRRAVNASEDRLEWSTERGGAADPPPGVEPSDHADDMNADVYAGAAHALTEHLARVDVTPGPVLARSLPAPEVLEGRLRIRHEVASDLLEIDLAAGSVARALRALAERYEGRDVEDDVLEAWDALYARSALLSAARARVAANERRGVYTGSRY